MTRKPPEDTKLLSLPTSLVDRLREASQQRGISIQSYASGALQEALRAEELRIPLGEAVEAYKRLEIDKTAGAMLVPRGILGDLVASEASKPDELQSLWKEAGHWYGHYISSKLNDKEIMPFLEREIKTAWNLDESEVKGADDVSVYFTCFNMSEQFTSLLLSYIEGLMAGLGFIQVTSESVRGMATIKYAKAPKD